jgi:hypothetical protein
MVFQDLVNDSLNDLSFPKASILSPGPPRPWSVGATDSSSEIPLLFFGGDCPKNPRLLQTQTIYENRLPSPSHLTFLRLGNGLQR